MTHVALDNTSPAPDRQHATHFLWSEFDALPRLLRDLMNYTPHPVGTGYVFAQLVAGMSHEAVARAAVARWRGYAREQTLRLYGPTHPQAQRPVQAS